LKRIGHWPRSGVRIRNEHRGLWSTRWGHVAPHRFTFRILPVVRVIPDLSYGPLKRLWMTSRPV